MPEIPEHFDPIYSSMLLSAPPRQGGLPAQPVISNDWVATKREIKRWEKEWCEELDKHECDAIMHL